MDLLKKPGAGLGFRGAMLAGAIVGAGMAASASAQEMRFAVGLPESSYNYDAAVYFAEKVAANSTMTVRVFALSLLRLNEIPGGIRDGLTDFGYSLLPYFPAEFSEVNLPANLSWLAATNPDARWPGAAMIGATTEYVMLNCPDCVRQLNAFNTVYLAGGAAVDYGLACNRPVPSLDAMAGLRIRTGAADLARFVEHFGGSNVSISGNEIYDALGTRNIACAGVPPETMVSLRLMEVADHFSAMMPGNMFSGVGMANMNRDRWISLSPEQRQVVMRAAGATGLYAWSIQSILNNEVLDAFAAAGNTVLHLSDDDKARIAAFAQADLAVVREQFATLYRVPNVDEKIALVSGLIEKWVGLTNQVQDRDVDALAALMEQEIYSKVDVGSYGIN
jgi:TRAP-type C4-dicarboxylate transport system substrate-binding protein